MRLRIWLDRSRLPGVLAERWDVEYESLIQRGSHLVVIRCATAKGCLLC